MQSKIRMDTTKTAKIISLITCCLVICLSVLGTSDNGISGVYKGCGWVERMCYHFMHANIFHTLMNVWCLLSIVFMYNVTLWRFATAFAIAVSIPEICLLHIPTIGLSGVIFALMGSISFEVERKLYYQAWIFAYLALGFVIPNVNAWLHVYCYLVGVAVALINKPIRIGDK